MTPNDAFSAWSRGYYLWQAHEVFGRASARKRHAQIKANMRGKHPVLSVFADALDDPDFLPIDKRVSPSETMEFFDLQRNMREELVKWIRKGKLMALGYAVPRHPDDKPRQVPADLWNFSPDWDHNRITGHGLSMEAIRVAPGETRDFVGRRTTRLPKPGRPSKKNIILAAYRDFLAEELIPPNLSIRQTCIQLQDWMKANRPDEYGNGKGFGLEVIRRTIGHLLKN